MSVPRRPRLHPANPWSEELSPDISAQERPLGRGLRPLSAPAGGEMAVCPHCWGLNPGGERLCGRCGADMTLLLQESGGLRRTPAVQSPVPVRVAGRLGPAMRAMLLLLTAVLALAWIIVPLLGGVPRLHRQRAGWRDSGMAGARRPSVPANRSFDAAAATSARTQSQPGSLSRRPAIPQSLGRRPTPAPSSATGRI